ncbi:acetyl-CoA synthetase [Bradyrhizobium shewense]|uniref:Acetyl-CoA synthetase n=2 Tax=Bradyrhizobium shewense TaxID=1761772 RepID=A0A1C3WK86_9BRAD|nr:acetyl-CoA synthetase [Bradyrhizobium shewense]
MAGTSPAMTELLGNDQAMLTEAATYDELTRNFRWDIPARFNMAEACCDRHADGTGRLALIYVDENGATTRTSFDEVADMSRRFANVLKADGLSRGDRVAVFLSQSLELPIAHMAAFRSGLVSIPLFALFGEDALEFRLSNSQAKAIITDEAGWEKLTKIRERLPYLQDIYITSGAVHAGAKPFWPAIETASEDFATVDTAADDPALIIYTSGTTGNPKGALHAHRVVLGHLPNVEMCHNFLPRPGDLMWTPADWAWIGGLVNGLLAFWYHGIPLVGHRARKFEPQAAMQMMADLGVRNVFLPPTALKLMRQAGVKHSGVKLRSIFTGGESLGGELLGWVRETFGIDAHEVFGQTECNLVIGSNSNLFPIRPGSMGKATPGFDVRIVNDKGEELPRGQRGIIGVRQPCPVTMLEYWRNPEATAKKYAGEFLLTGDLGVQDEDGYFWYVSREDDVITTAGYRVGPSEIEHTLMKHPSVAMAAVVGIPDPIRTESIKAWIVLRPGFTGTDALAREIQEFVKVQLAAHEYPRFVEFAETLPMTATGKVLRRELRAKG